MYQFNKIKVLKDDALGTFWFYLYVVLWTFFVWGDFEAHQAAFCVKVNPYIHDMYTKWLEKICSAVNYTFSWLNVNSYGKCCCPCCFAHIFLHAWIYMHIACVQVDSIHIGQKVVSSISYCTIILMTQLKFANIQFYPRINIIMRPQKAEANLIGFNIKTAFIFLDRFEHFLSHFQVNYNNYYICVICRKGLR